MTPSLRNLMRKVVQSQTQVNVDVFNLTCTTGIQSHSDVSFLGKSTLTSMETAANAGFATPNSLRLFLKSGKVTCTLRNQTNTNAHVKLYDIVCKRDPPSTGFDTPREAWNKGLTDYAGIPNLYDVVGQTPFRSPEFNHYFRVVKVTNLHMEPGMEHVHTVRHHYNKLYSTVRTQNAAGVSVAGFTRFIMPVFYGTLVHESATPGTVTTSAITLDCMIRREYSFGFLTPTAPAFTVFDGLPKAIVDTDFMGESGDVDSSVLAA